MDNQVYYMVVNNIEDRPLDEAQKEIYGKNASSYYYSLYIGIDGNRGKKLPVEIRYAAIGASGMEEGHDGKYYIMIEKGQKMKIPSGRCMVAFCSLVFSSESCF